MSLANDRARARRCSLAGGRSSAIPDRRGHTCNVANRHQDTIPPPSRISAGPSGNPCSRLASRMPVPRQGRCRSPHILMTANVAARAMYGNASGTGPGNLTSAATPSSAASSFALAAVYGSFLHRARGQAPRAVRSAALNEREGTHERREILLLDQPSYPEDHGGASAANQGSTMGTAARASKSVVDTGL